jgi:recombination protein RecA
MSQALRKLTATIGRSHTILIFINQIRMKIGIMFGNPETTTGGNALKFYASVRLEVRKIETIEKTVSDAIGNRVRVKVVKNKVAPPFRRVELDIMFGKGISASGSLLDAAVKYEIIDKKGAWYAYNEEKVGQGRDNAKIYLEEHPDFAKEVDAKVRKVMFPGREAPAEAVPLPAARESASSAKSAAVVSSDLPEDAPSADESDENFDSAASEPVTKRGVGRPRKTPVELVQALSEEE